MRLVSFALTCVLILLLGANCPAMSDETAAETSVTANSTEKAEVHSNRLAKESSPYLLLHAHNPVDWFPWGPEALEKARAENKIIFLSVGYSSCYWCHVMEREVFSNPKIAQFMNEHFVNVKVDREERPDIDDIYMTSLIVYQQAVGSPGGGGWPLSMFLTPDGHPVAGATYLPPEDSPDGRTGFMTAATTIVNVWKEREENVRKSGKVLAAEVRRLSGPEAIGEPFQPTADSVLSSVKAIEGLYDSEFGGVDHRPGRSGGPRFPNVPRLSLLLSFSRSQLGTPEERTEAENMLQHSLRAMAAGGIRDHLGGGFHRYSTDREWHVPHFEKMLYDQAQMLEIYARTALLTNDAEFTAVAGEIADFVQREMTRPEGGFCSALDAETNTIEGEYYVWSVDEVKSVLGETDARAFMERYSMLTGQTFEHGYVLRLTAPASASSLNPAESVEIQQMKQKLLARRSERERPLLDDKVLTEWNGMMIQALAISSQLPGRSGDLESAARAADFVLAHLRDSDGHLLRSWRNDKAVYKAYLDDYAWMVSALLTLHDVTQNPQWLTRASELNNELLERFYDRDLKTFFFTSDSHEELIARSSPVYDSVYPSGTSISLLNLLRLSEILSTQSSSGSDDANGYRQIVRDVLGRTGNKLHDSPSGCSGLAIVLQKLQEHQHSGVPDDVGSAMPPNADQVSGNSCGIIVDEEPVTEVAADEQSDEDGESVTTFKPVVTDPMPGRGFLRDENDERPVTAKSFLYFDKLERGGQCPIAIELVMGENWHINANPANPDFLKPTEIKITSKQKVKLTRVKYPKHEEFKMTGSEEAYHVYSDRVIIYGLLEIDGSETAADAELEIKIDFQACNSNECLPPDQIILKGKVPMVNAGDPLKKINEAKFKLLKPAEKQAEEEKAEVKPKESKP